MKEVQVLENLLKISYEQMRGGGGTLFEKIIIFREIFKKLKL
jgi:hypothetical protein